MGMNDWSLKTELTSTPFTHCLATLTLAIREADPWRW